MGSAASLDKEQRPIFAPSNNGGSYAHCLLRYLLARTNDSIYGPANFFANFHVVRFIEIVESGQFRWKSNEKAGIFIALCTRQSPREEPMRPMRIERSSGEKSLSSGSIERVSTFLWKLERSRLREI
jgi:hypothetical protein